MLAKTFILLAITFIPLAIASPVPAQAQTCATTSDVLAKLAGSQSTLQRLSNSIEGVAPSDQEFILNEERLALESRNRARFRAISSHRHYQAAKFHAEIKKATSRLSQIRIASDAKSFSIIAAEVLGSFYSIGTAATNYMEADRARDRPILSQNDRENLYFLIEVARLDLTNLTRCAIEAIPIR